MGVKNKLCGYEVEHMPNLSFRLMSFVFTLRDVLFSVGKKLDQFNIEEGFIIVDFGCGPGSFIEHASNLVGNAGKVYAVDVQPLAIKAVKEKAKRKKLKNVVPFLSTGYPINIDSHLADVIYALDMFHHIKDTRGFLKELHRLLKPSGKLFIECGHQRRDKAEQKIVASDCWVIIKSERNLFECIPKDPQNV